MADIELVIKIPEEYYKAITEIPNHQCTADMLIIKNGTPICDIDQIRAEIAEYKDDKVIHAERNEMIDIVLEILDKYREE